MRLMASEIPVPGDKLYVAFGGGSVHVYELKEDEAGTGVDTVRRPVKSAECGDPHPRRSQSQDPSEEDGLGQESYRATRSVAG
jgi:hypothetical protein